MVAIRSPAFGFGWDDDTPWGEGVSADKSGVEGGAINSRRCVRGMWGSMGRIGMAFGGVGSASEREAECVFMPTEYEYQPLDELIATPPFTRCSCYYRYTYGVWQGCIATDCFYGRIFLL